MFMTYEHMFTTCELMFTTYEYRIAGEEKENIELKNIKKLA